jgi:phosphotransacetylase
METKKRLAEQKEKEGVLEESEMITAEIQRELEENLSHPILQGKPNASHMCARINLHTHDRQNESNTIAVIKRSRVKPVRYPLLHPERWTRRSEHNDN